MTPIGYIFRHHNARVCARPGCMHYLDGLQSRVTKLRIAATIVVTKTASGST